MYPDIRIELVHITPEEVQQLRSKLEETQQKADKLLHDKRIAEMELAVEQRINNELIELCKKSGVSFRPSLERGRTAAE